MVCFDILSRATLTQTRLVYFYPDLKSTAGSFTIAEAMQIIIGNLFCTWYVCAVCPCTICLSQDYAICHSLVIVLVSSLSAS